MRAEEITAGTSPSAARAVAEVVLDDEVVLYHEELNTVHVLNATASLVWSTLDGARSVAQMAAVLAPRFDVPVEQIRSDVLDVVREFGRQGLLTGIEPIEEAIDANRLSGPDEPEAPRD